jgi:hypothetical protein
MDFGLSGRVALVAAASKGIGFTGVTLQVDGGWVRWLF